MIVAWCGKICGVWPNDLARTQTCGELLFVVMPSRLLLQSRELRELYVKHPVGFYVLLTVHFSNI